MRRYRPVSTSGTLSDDAFLDILLQRPDWANGLPLSGKVHSGPHYLAAPEQPAEPLGIPDSETATLERAIDCYINTPRAGMSPAQAE